MDPSTQTPRRFTLEEASALLPQVRPLVAQIQNHVAELERVQAQLEAFRERKRRGEHPVEGEARLVQQALAEAEGIGGRMRTALDELLALGCELKDVRLGLVDFPSLRDGRTVYLCWRAGEATIAFWHELDAGFAGRQPLSPPPPL